MLVGARVDEGVPPVRAPWLVAWWAGERPLSPAGCRLLLSAVAAVRAVPCLFGFTPPTHAHPHPGPTVPDPPPPLRSVRPHGVPPCLALLPSLCTRCRPCRLVCCQSCGVCCCCGWVVVGGGRVRGVVGVCGGGIGVVCGRMFVLLVLVIVLLVALSMLVLV